MAVSFFESDDVAGHVEIIRRQVNRSIQDRQTVQLAQQIVKGQYDQLVYDEFNTVIPIVFAWGQPYQLTYGRAQKAVEPIDEVMAIWNFYVCNVQYVLDPDGIGDNEEIPVDMFSTVELTLESGTGDCDDATVTMGALLKSLGWQVWARIISTNDDTWEHVYLVVGSPKGRYAKIKIPLDATVQGAIPGWEYADATHSEDIAL